MSGWTYFVRGNNGGPIKIGFTNNDPQKRLSTLATGSPVELKLVGVISGNHEKELHKQFATERLHGEWFQASENLLAFIDVHAASTFVEDDSPNEHVTTKTKSTRRRIESEETDEKLWAFTTDGRFSGLVVEDDRQGEIQIELYDAFMLIGCGLLVLSGELKTVARESARIFNDKGAFKMALGVLLQQIKDQVMETR